MNYTLQLFPFSCTILAFENSIFETHSRKEISKETGIQKIKLIKKEYSKKLRLLGH
jgi:hypothetical protein